MYSSWKRGETAADPVTPYKTAATCGLYQRFTPPVAIDSPEVFLVSGIAQIVNDAAQSFSSRGDGIPHLVNAAIQIVEESYVVFSADDCIDQYLENIADCVVEFVKATGVHEERDAVLRLGNALDDLGATLNIFHGEIAQTANLKLRVLSRLLLVNSMRPILDNSNKNAEIDFLRLGRINNNRRRQFAR